MSEQADAVYAPPGSLAEFIVSRLDDDETERFAAISPWLEKRWLAEIEAKRRIVELERDDPPLEDALGAGCAACDELWRIAHDTPVLRALATIWADHEDYDPAWRLT